MVLVTGGTGLVGAHLLLHLIENGETVRAIYRNSKSIEKTKSLFDLYSKKELFDAVEWIQADILDVPALEHAFPGIEYVYHCAALISFDSKDENLIRKTNIEGTANIVNFCLANDVKKLCFVSSVAALGDLKEHEKITTEEAEWNPEKSHSDYAISKYGAEMEIWRGQQEGLKAIIVNPGVIIGPGFWKQGSGILFTQVKNGLPFYTLGTTGFVAVPDLVRIMCQLMKSEASDSEHTDEIINERYTLISQNIAYRDILNTIADGYGVKKPSLHAKPWLMMVLWRIDWILSNVFGQKRKLSYDIAKASYSTIIYSNEKIKNVLKTEFLDIHQYIKAILSL